MMGLERAHLSLSLSCDAVRLYSGRESSDNILFGPVVRKHGLGDRKNTREIFVDLCSSHRLDICGTLSEHGVCYKVS